MPHKQQIRTIFTWWFSLFSQFLMRGDSYNFRNFHRIIHVLVGRSIFQYFKNFWTWVQPDDEKILRHNIPQTQNEEMKFPQSSEKWRLFQFSYYNLHTCRFFHIPILQKFPNSNSTQSWTNFPQTTKREKFPQRSKIYKRQAFIR